MDSVIKDASDYTVRMHLAIDIREACRTKRAGKGQWTYGFVAELLTRNLKLTLFTDGDLPPEWRTQIASHAGITARRITRKGFSWHSDVAREVKADRTIDAYVSTVSYIVPVLLGKSKPVIPVVHDLIAFRGEPHDKRATFIERFTLGRAVRHASRICTVSETTKLDLLLKFPWLDAEKVAPVFAAPLSPPALSEDGGDHILCIATLCPRKNQLRLIEAYAGLPPELRERYPLILVGGRGWNDEDIVRLASETPGVEWKSYLSDQECRSLMQRAACFAFPSLYEGFGLPIVDAMAAGVPVITSDIGSMKEVAADAALLVNPLDTASIRDGLVALLTDSSLHAALVERGRERVRVFSWKRTVDLFLEVTTGIDKRL